MQKDMETLVVYYVDSTYSVYTENYAGVRRRRRSRTSFRCVFRVKLKDKTNAQVCS
jgi:hypothetical protein